MKISAVIPVYKNKKLFLRMLENNIKYLKDVEIVVADDASAEGLKQDLKEKYPEVKVIVNEKNLGFSKTVNLAVKEATGEFILLLNSDVKLIDDSFKKAIGQLKKDKNLFAVSFVQIEKDKSLVGKNRLFFKRGLFHHQKADDLKRGFNAWAEGGASLIRKKYFDQLSGFDGIFTPFYWEDTDLSYRAYKRGWQVIFDPKIKVEHHHESTIGKFFDRSYIKIIAFRNQFFFIWKNLTDWSLFLSHLLWLPYNLVYFLLKGEKEFIVGFTKAIPYLDSLIKKKKSESKKSKFSDKEVLKLLS